MKQLKTEFTPLVEKAIRPDGSIRIKMIQPGWGSSGFYSESVLKRDIPKAFPEKTFMFWNHPTISEEAERPEGDLRHLAAVTVSEPYWDNSGADGAGMYVQAKPFGPYRETIDEIGKHIGVSIRGHGTSEVGEVEGREGRIINSITNGLSVDFVTKPGAGGSIMEIFEAAPNVKGQGLTDIREEGQGQIVANSSLEDQGMSEKDKQDDNGTAVLESSVRELAKTIAELRQELSVQTANGMVVAALAEAELPDLVATRLTKQLAIDPPMKEGVLDEAAFGDVIKTAITEAQAEIVAITGKNATIAGQGGSNSTDDKWPTLEESDKALEDALAGLRTVGGK